MHEAVSQSLAGRPAVLTLLPFSSTELNGYPQMGEDVFERIVAGGYPRLHEERLSPGRFFASYLATYVERDVRSLVNIKDLTHFQAFLKLLAGRVGQMVNLSSLANDIGVTSTTLRHWLEILKACYLLFELPPWFENISKRLVKSPKLYFYDTGLLCHLLGIATAEHLERDPLRGGLFENYVILELLKQEWNAGRQPDFLFYRDSAGNEVDLVVRRGRKLQPVEIKSATTFIPDFCTGIERFSKTLADSRLVTPTVYYNGHEPITFKQFQVIPAKALGES